VNLPSIDETDVKIIRILQEDPRTTYLKLAKDCGVSIDSVRRRYERLRKEGIVVREIIALHPKAMGLECFSWLGIITQPGKEREVLSHLAKKPEVELNFIEMGKYNIRSLLILKHMTELGPFVDSLKKIPAINDIDVMIWSEIERMAYPGNLIIEPSSGCKEESASKVNDADSEVMTSSTSYVTDEKTDKHVALSAFCPSLDKIDETILNTLSRKARIPFSTIAKQLGISTKTVICRYRKLQKKWVWYTTLCLNLRKLGYSGYVSYNIKVSSKSWVNDVFDQMVKLPNVIVALKLIGPYNINALVPISSPEQLMKIHTRISEIPGIERIDQQIGDSMHVWPRD
jgi:DNA-binding Lrp family transcriptional regulator